MKQARVKTCWPLALAALALGGCRTGGGDGNTAHVRMINAVPDANDLTVAVDGKRVWKRSLYRTNTGYQDIPEGAYDVRLNAHGPSVTEVALRPLEFVKDRHYTVLALGLTHGATLRPGVRVFTDDEEKLPDGKAGLRVINAAAGVGRIDVLINSIVALDKVGVGGRSETLPLDRGTYEVRINVANEVETVVGPVTVRLEPGRSYTMVLMGRRGTGSLALETYPDR